MGITDEVEIKLYCPYCSKELPNKSFQTKDLNPDMSRYNIIQALIENQKQGGGWIHLFFSCKNCNHAGEIEISMYDWELEKEIREVLKEEKDKLNMIENEFMRKYEKLEDLK